MFLIIGFVIVLASTLGGFSVAGGSPMVLVHVSEIIVICGVTLGLVVAGTPLDQLIATMKGIMGLLKGDGPSKNEFLDLLKMLYEMFTLGRRNGLIALDEHVEDPDQSSIMSKYQSFVKNEERLEFLINNLRPLIDGKIKPEQIGTLMNGEIKNKHDEGAGPVHVMHLAADSLPGIGICAAVLGIIITMGVIDQGAGAVGHKVSAALTGSFLGVWLAYGFAGPTAARLHMVHEKELTYYKILAEALSGFAKGLAPAMAIEVARRALPSDAKPSATELETMLKELTSK
ncbi:MAG: flagellar motor stator protein MotA [Opitutales bacterium]|nr:flagellar motor stator protein MotA [Opitutales bacterium]